MEQVFSITTRVKHTFIGVALTCLAASPSLAQASRHVTIAAQGNGQTDGEDIVVTAQRSGIPVWRVSGPKTTIVLVGSIRTVAAGTRWNPAPLEASLLKADRIMFPETTSFGLGLGSAIGALSKWRKQATLPKGQTLQTMLSPDQFARLVALRTKGVLKPGFERKHPYHLAQSLGSAMTGKRAPNVDAYVRRVARKNKLKMVPLAQGDAKAMLAEFFATAPKSHVPCLMDAVALAEAGRGAVKARSDAWAKRRVPAALASVAGRMEQSCYPEGSRFERARAKGLTGVVRALLAQPKVTIAVIPLDSLASRGGVLDDLVAAGFDVRGPAWKP